MALIDEIKEFSQETLVEQLIGASELSERDRIKGILLAYADFEPILKAYEDKPLAKLEEYLEKFDVYNDTGNLNLFINVTEPRQETVLLSKMETLTKIKTKLLTYVRATIESTPISAVHSEEVGETEGGEEVPAESKVQTKRGRK